MSEDLTGLWLARRDTRWDPYPHDDGERVLVHVTRWGCGDVWRIRSARHGFEWPVPLVLVARAHGPVAQVGAR